MKSNRLLFYIVTAVSLLCLSSCQKFYMGKTIKVHSRTHTDRLSTKTAYNGDTYSSGSATYERIDWSSGDMIVLAMKNNETSQAQHVYEIQDIEANGRFSEAGLEPGGGNGLEWGTGTHDFWGAYPSTVTMGDHTATAEIPSVQTATYQRKKNDVLLYGPDMSKAFMVASQQATPSSAGINMDFYPAFTAFDFTVGTNDDIVIKGFEMETTTSGSGAALTGTVTATFDPSNNMRYDFSSTSTGQNVSISFKNAGGSDASPSLSVSNKINFKVFCLPQDITGVRIKFTVSGKTGDVTHSLNLKQNGSWITFPACVKTNITGLLIPGAVWYIKFDYPREEQWIENSEIEVGVE